MGMDHQGTDKKIKASSAHDSRKRTVIAITLSGALVLSAITAYYLHFRQKISDHSTASNQSLNSPDSPDAGDAAKSSSSNSKIGSGSITKATNESGSNGKPITNQTGNGTSVSVIGQNNQNESGRTNGSSSDSYGSAKMGGAPDLNVATGLPVGTNAKITGGLGGAGHAPGITATQENGLGSTNPNANSKEKAAEDAKIVLQEKAKNSCMSAFFKSETTQRLTSKQEIELEDADANVSTACVYLDNKAIPFTIRNGKTIVADAKRQFSEEHKLEVRYCKQGVNCHDKCQKPKKETNRMSAALDADDDTQGSENERTWNQEKNENLNQELEYWKTVKAERQIGHWKEVNRITRSDCGSTVPINHTKKS